MLDKNESPRLVLVGGSKGAALQVVSEYLSLLAEAEVLELSLKAMKGKLELMAPDVEAAVVRAGGEVALGGKVLRVIRTVYASVPAGREAEAFDQLRAFGWGDLIKETVNASSLSARYRKALADRLLMGALPDVLQINEKQSLSVRQGT